MEHRHSLGLEWKVLDRQCPSSHRDGWSKFQVEVHLLPDCYSRFFWCQFRSFAASKSTGIDFSWNCSHKTHFRVRLACASQSFLMVNYRFKINHKSCAKTHPTVQACSTVDSHGLIPLEVNSWSSPWWSPLRFPSGSVCPLDPWKPLAVRRGVVQHKYGNCSYFLCLQTDWKWPKKLVAMSVFCPIWSKLSRHRNIARRMSSTSWPTQSLLPACLKSMESATWTYFAPGIAGSLLYPAQLGKRGSLKCSN